LSGCATTVYNQPSFPVGGKSVAVELEKYCIKKHNEGVEVLCPNTFEWLDRLGKYKDKIEVK